MYRVRTTFSGLAGSPWVSNLFFSEETFTAAQAASAVATFIEALDNFMSSNVLWQVEPEVTTIDASTGHPTSVISTAGAAGQGDLAVESMPPGSQLVIRWRTGVFVQGHERRGRMFVPGLTQDANDQGRVIAATQTGVAAAAAAFLADANSVPVVWHRPTDTPPTNGTQHFITSSSVWNQFGHLRTRRD